MMEILFKWFRFYLCLSFFQLCNGNPVNPIDTEIESNAKVVAGVISLLLTVCFLVFIVACLCCQRRKRFEQFRDSPVTASSIPDLDHGHINPIANREFTIFSPLSPKYNNNVSHENKPKTKTVEDSLANSYDISPWFNSNEPDYPRTRLKYIKELGSGWFGKVVEGAVQDEDNKGRTWTPVVVRILEATSSQKEKILFLQNAEIYRIGNHTNILSLIGRSLETVPYLLLQEWCPQGDLKTYLRSQKNNAEHFLSTEYPLLWCYQLTSALKYIHEQDIVHLDLAGRNCQLTNNLTLKLGDYGLGPFKYPSDYYQGQSTVPVRWCSPESLIYTQTTIQPKRVTPEANVWALAVTMWEICECGEQPYWNLSDDEVISQVLGSEGVRLSRPTLSVLYTDYIFRLMQLCWISVESRPKVVQIHIMLTDLLQVYKHTSSTDIFDVDEFDRRWESCKPNTIIKTDHIAETILDSDGDDLRKSLSLSLTNLHGSLDNLAFHDLDKCTNEQSKLTDVLKCEDSFQRTNSSGSETEEENWRNKVEIGAYTEKVRQKSRSVADLMVLTHVDYSESESETPLHSLEYRVNYKNVRLAGLDGVNSLENSSITYGSEGNLLNVQDTFKEELRKLKEERRDSLLFVPENISQSSFRNTETSNVPSSRLIQELNSPVDIQPVNQVFNIYNVTIDNFSPIHMNKFSDILDVNSQLKPEWKEVEKLRQIDCELTQEIRELEKLNQVQKVYSDEDEMEDLNEIPVESDEMFSQNAPVASDQLIEVVEAEGKSGLSSDVKVLSGSKHRDREKKMRDKDYGSHRVSSRDRDKERDRSRHRKSSRHKKDIISSTDKLDKKSKEILEQLVDNIIFPPLEDRLWKHVPQEDIFSAIESDSDHEPSSTVTIPTPPRVSENEEEKNQPISPEKEKKIDFNIRSMSPPPPPPRSYTPPPVKDPRLINKTPSVVSPIPPPVVPITVPPPSLSIPITIPPPPILPITVPPPVSEKATTPPPLTDEGDEPYSPGDSSSPDTQIIETPPKLSSGREPSTICYPEIPGRYKSGFDLNQNVKETFKDIRDSESKDSNSVNQNYKELSETVDINPELNRERRLSEEQNFNLKLEESTVDNNLNQNMESTMKLSGTFKEVTNKNAIETNENEGREVDCKVVLEKDDGSEVCNNGESGVTNLTIDVLRGDDSLQEDNVECEAFNFNIRLPSKVNETILRLHDDGVRNEGENVGSIDKANGEEKNKNAQSNIEANDQKSLEETILVIIDEIVTRSLDEVSQKSMENQQDEENPEQIVKFDVSLSQEEVKPNSLTHSSLFTSSTPFKKRSLENKLSSMKLEDNYVPDNSDLNYSLETWDNFLGSTLDHQNQHPENMFDSFSFEPQSLLFIEGDGINEKCDKLQYVENRNTVLPDVVNSSYLANSSTHDVNKKKETSNSGDDVLNSTFIKDEPDVLQVYSGDIWNKYLDSPSGNTFDDFSSEPQSLIFVESEGVYKNCDNVNEVDKCKEVLPADDDAKLGTAKDSSHVNTVDLQTTYNKEDDVLNSTYSKEDGILNSTYSKDAILNSTYTKEESEVSKTSSDDLDEGSFENGGGWFLHPQPTNELSGDIQLQSPSTDSYIGFGIDDEIMSAIRNELLNKLPHAQGNNTERVREEDDLDMSEKNEVFLTYKVLSPIPEESYIEDASGTNTPRQEREEETDWSGRTDTDTLTIDNETTSAHTLESPLRGTFNRHTPSQDSCCSNDTLFNLEDLICGQTDLEKDADNIFNVKSIGEAKEDKQLVRDDENVDKNDGSEEVESITTVTSKSQDIVNNFLSTERKYSAGVPLPSPEENPWKQLPASLLNYNQLTLSNSHSIKEEPQIENYSDCDSVEKQKICDAENIEIPTGNLIEHEEDVSEQLNVTFTKDHPDVMELPTVSLEQDTKMSEIKPELEEDTPSVASDKENIEPHYANVKEETEIVVIKDEEKNKRLYENVKVNQFDDYVNMENSKNRLESDVSDKDHTYIDTYEPIDKEEDDSIYGILTDIRFTGPGDSQMMSTSFSENNDEQGWESGSDSRSSSSGEFIWREGEHEEYLKALRAAPQDVLESVTPMEGIVEDNYEESDLSSNFSDEEESPEFVPSAWDKFAMPSKSALRSPEKTPKKREEKKPKGVWFKKQKYHCIYEYPKEPESPVLPTPDAWKQPDFKVFSDNPASTNLADDFFMTSSNQPFQTHNLSSQFFPGNSTWTFDNATPDSGMEDITPGSTVDLNEFTGTSISVPTLKQLASDVVNRKKLPSLGSSESLGGLRHTKKLLKLDLPPSPSAFSSEKIFTIEPTVEPVIRDKPTFTTFGKSRFFVQHVETPPDASLVKNVSFEALPYKPLSPNLDDSSLTCFKKPLSIVEDLSRLDTDLIERNFIKNENDDKCKLKVEVVRGEASLLDSGDEDSGIESTSTLERKVSNPELL